MENANKESFTQLYTRLYNENFKELEEMREKEKSSAIKIIIALICVFITFPIFPPLGAVLLIVFVVMLCKIGIQKIKSSANVINRKIVNGEVVSNTVSEGQKPYKIVYKEKIIEPMIKNVFDESSYYPSSGLNRNEYNRARWEYYDIYSSEDKIVAALNIDEKGKEKTELVISEVHTQNESTDSEGHTSRTTLFHGLAGYVNLPKDMGCYIKVKRDSLDIFGKPKDRLDMDMQEFEKRFDVSTDNRIKAMQILTVDIMTELIDFANKYKIRFEFYINHDIMHIRFFTGEMFEPDIFSKTLQLEKMKKCFDRIEMIKNVTEHICRCIHDTEL